MISRVAENCFWFGCFFEGTAATERAITSD